VLAWNTIEDQAKFICSDLRIQYFSFHREYSIPVDFVFRKDPEPKSRTEHPFFHFEIFSEEFSGMKKHETGMKSDYLKIYIQARFLIN
jgi:hypothetical protein